MTALAVPSASELAALAVGAAVAVAMGFEAASGVPTPSPAFGGAAGGVTFTRTGSVRSRVTGITSDGRLILRLPSGRTAIVAPDEGASAPRHRNRGYIDRDQMLGPPPGFEPDYFQGD